MNRKLLETKKLQTAACSCGQFERIGILCGHALKVIGITLLPTHYIVKRWTREARSGSIKDCRGRTIVDVQVTSQVSDELLIATRLKKKEARKKGQEEIRVSLRGNTR
jgi:hypothetical protein